MIYQGVTVALSTSDPAIVTVSNGVVMFHGYTKSLYSTWSVHLLPCTAHLKAAKKLVTELERLIAGNTLTTELRAIAAEAHPQANNGLESKEARAAREEVGHGL